MRHKSDCKRGTHAFGRQVEVGGGIRRQVCKSCGLVEIDLCSDAEVEDSKLFAPVRTDSIFAIQSVLEAEFELPERRFGVRPSRRSIASDVS